MGLKVTTIPVRSIAHSATTGRTATDHQAEFDAADALAAIDAAALLTLAGGQINFPDTQDKSADANTLDDYEEGIWTPEIADNTLDGSGEGQVYGSHLGTYVKIGCMVFIHLRVSTTGIGTLTGANQVSIVGLPFVALTRSGLTFTAPSSLATGLALAAAQDQVVGSITDNTAVIKLRVFNLATGDQKLTVDQWSADGTIHMAGHYVATAS